MTFGGDYQDYIGHIEDTDDILNKIEKAIDRQTKAINQQTMLQMIVGSFMMMDIVARLNDETVTDTYHKALETITKIKAEIQ